MKEKRLPQRLCLGCNTSKPKAELIRVVRSPSGEPSVDFSGKLPGRGAYICNSAECLRRVQKSKRLSRALDCPISDDIFEKLQRDIAERQDNFLALISISKKAGKAVIGRDNIKDAAAGKRLRLLVLASDAAADSQKAAEKMSDSGVPVIVTRYTKIQLGGSIGFSEAALVGITDAGLAAEIKKYHTETDTEEKA